MGNGDMAAALAGAPEQQQFWLAKNDFWRLKEGSGGPKALGRLVLDMPALKGASYFPSQRLQDGSISACFSKKDGPSVTMKAWVAATENLLVIELTANGSPVETKVQLQMLGKAGRVNGTLTNVNVAEASQNGGTLAKVSEASQNGVFWGSRSITENVDIPAAAACAVRLLGAQGRDLPIETASATFVRWNDEVAPMDLISTGQSVVLEPGKPVAVLVGMASLRQNPEYLNAAQKQVGQLSGEGLAPVREQHRQWWDQYWSKSFVVLNDPYLEWRYYVSYYLMGACSRDPDFPPGIMGTWVTTDETRWGGDYTLDYNAHAPFYGLCSGNRIEQADPQAGPMLAFLESGKKYSQLILGHKGALYPVRIGAKGINTNFGHARPGGPRIYSHGVVWYGMKSNAAYSMVIMAERWFMTRDLAFARRVYPFVREVATFWEEDLKFEKSRYMDYDDAIMEGLLPDDVNNVLSLGLIRMVMRTALDMSAALGTDSERREKWQHIQSHLSPFPTQTWPTNGKTIFRYTEKGLAWFHSNALGIWHIFPAGAIGLESDPKLLEISRNTIGAMEEGDVYHPYQTRWYDGNAQSSWYPVLARIGYEPRAILAGLRGVPFFPNGMVINRWHGIENCSIFPNTINEMLLQSHQDVLRLFPCWPKEKDARFGTLRAYGAFLVSAELKNGEVGPVSILSEKGRDCTLVNPWPGNAVTLVRNGQVAEILSGERFTFKTTAGETIALEVQSSAAQAR